MNSYLWLFLLHESQFLFYRSISRLRMVTEALYIYFFKVVLLESAVRSFHYSNLTELSYFIFWDSIYHFIVVI